MAGVTDDERRRIALECRERAYREEFTGEVVARTIGTFTSGKSRYDHDAWYRLADLIEPTPTSSDTTATHSDASATCGVSQSRRSEVDPAERGIDSIYEWCRERLEGADGAEDELYCAIMSAVEGYRHPELVTARTVRAVDREALLALASLLSDIGAGFVIDRKGAREVARRIRDACGEAANGLPTRGAARTPARGGKAQVGGDGRAAAAGARHEKN